MQVRRAQAGYAVGMRWLPLVAITVGLACRRNDTRAIVPDPAPKADAGPTPKDPPRDELTLLHGKSLDLRLRAVRHVLTPELPRREAARADDAYLLDRKTAVLQAFSLESGARRWSKPAPLCSVLGAMSGGAFCAQGSTVTHYPRADGVAHAQTLAADVNALLPLRARLAVLRSDHQIEMLDGTTAASHGAVALPFAPYGHRSTLVESAYGTACAVSAPGPDVEVACVTDAPALAWHKKYLLRKPTDPPGTYFQVRELGPRFVLVSSWFSSGGARRAVVVDLKDGAELARLEEEIAATVATETGALDGLFATQPTTRLLSPTGVVRWTSTEKLNDSASAVLFDGTLAVASFHAIATGASLLGFDPATGAVRFRGDVELLPIGHSKYFNATSVSIAAGALALRGREAGQDYLELFDAKTGKRLFTELTGSVF